MRVRTLERRSEVKAGGQMGRSPLAGPLFFVLLGSFACTPDAAVDSAGASLLRGMPAQETLSSPASQSVLDCPAAQQLSDEFDDPCSLTAWNQENLSTVALDIGARAEGRLSLSFLPTAPSETGWYQDYVGPYLFKSVTGDFRVRTHVRAGNLAGMNQPPTQLFNSAGLLVRDPESVTGDQDWLMFDLGYQYTFVGTESKTTQDSQSILTLDPTGDQFSGELLVCRAGADVRMFSRLDGASSWAQVNAYARPDLPSTLDVGLMANGWVSPADLQAEYDYVRFDAVGSSADCTVEALNAAYPPEVEGCPGAEGFDDEFDDPCSLSAWNIENTAFASLDIGETQAGALTLTFDETTPPYYGWYQNFGGPALTKAVSGNFLVVTRLSAGSPGNASEGPSTPYNAAGLLVRDPASQPGDQDWIAFNLGYQESFIGTEGKTTDESISVLTLVPTAGVFSGRLAMCRFGSQLQLFRYLDGAGGWTLAYSYDRPDFPETLDLGLMANAWTPPATIQPEYDYIRLFVPQDASDCSEAALNSLLP